MNLSAQFKAFLLSQKKRPSEVTVKNYLADVSQFISWCEKNGTAFTPHQISHKMLQDYLTAKQLSQASRERHLSSLRKFFTFLKDEKYITELPFPSSTKPSSDDPWSLHDFRSHLTLNKASHPTVKNYLTDIKHFTSWITNKHAALGTQAISHSYFALVTGKALEEYKVSLQEAGFSTPSINRKLSSLRRYLHWASEKGLPEAKKVSIANISKKKEEVPNSVNELNSSKVNRYSQKFNNLTSEPFNRSNDPLGIINPVKGTIPGTGTGTAKQIQDTELTPSTQEELTQSFHTIMHEPKNPSYSRFAPLRLVQKLRHGIILALDVTIIDGTAYVIEHMAYMRWIASGKQIFTASAKNGLAHEDSKNEISSLRLIAPLGNLVSQVMAVVYPPAHSYRHDMAKHHKAFYHMRHTRPNWYKKYHELPMVHYFHFAALIIMMSAIGFMGYQAFFDDTGTSQAALPTAPPRVLSFQGRLTDSFDNPIDSATSLRFAIYNDLSASGAAMLWQEVQTTTPDQDGIFSVLLGSSTSIPDSVFRENSALYLGITVGTDSELQPRQQIATVAFAANSESLQGLLPITAGGAGTSNVVLALDSTGNLTIGGSATPTFEATGGQFTLSGNVLNLTTSEGTNSNVQLNPDGTGTVDVMKPLQNSTLNNNIPSAAGAVEVNDMFAVLATSSGQSAFTLNQDGAGPILSASSSGIARFTVSNNGTGYFAGNVGIGSTSPAYKLDVQGGSGVVGRFSGRVIGASAVNNNEFVTLSQLSGSVSGSTFWQLNSNALSPINSTYDVLVGGTATSSALVKLGGTSGATSFFNTGGNVGIGTTAPAAKLDISTDGAGPQTLLTLRGAVSGINQSYSFIMNADKTVTVSGGSSNTKTIFQATNASGFAPLAVRGASGQTSNLFQVENNSGTALSVFNGSGNLGIGSTSPTQKLDVIGNAVVSGNLGVGTTAPGAKVDVQGSSATIFTALTLQNTNTTAGAETYLNMPVFNGTRGFHISQSANAVGPSWAVGSYDAILRTGQSGSYLHLAAGASNNPQLSIKPDGNIGIGTTAPGSLVDIYGASPTLTFRNSGGTNLADTGVILFSETVAPAGIKLRYDGSTGTGGGTFNITDITSGVNTDLVSVMRNGNVGIGTTAPGSKLHVNGSAFFNTNTESTPFVIGRTNLTSEILQVGINDANLNMNYINDEASSRWNFGVQNTDTESGGGVSASNYTILTLYGSTGGGNVGIGSITPGYKLDVQDGTGIVGRFSGRVIGADAVNTNEFVTLSQLTSGTGQYWTRLSGNLYPSTITDNVGIGTTAPTGARLDVRGGTDYIARFIETGVTPEASSILGTSDQRAISVQGNGGAFFMGRDVTNDIEFIMGSSTSGLAFAGSVTAHDFELRTNNTSRLFVQNSSGNIGIGTTSPSSLFAVGSSSQFQVNSSGAIAAAAGVVSSGNIDFSSLSAGGMVKADATTGRLSVATAGTDYEVPLTFGNGLTRTSNAVSLGGTLTGNTDIALGGYNFTLSGLGNVGIGTTTPSSKLSLVSNGSVANLFDITDNGSTIFQVTQSNIVANVPAQFNAAGDVSIAYDLNFTNPTASYIKSSAPLYMSAGEVFGSSDLTLRTYNSGNVIVDSQALSVTGSATVSGQLTVGGTTTLSNYTTNGGVLYTNGSGTIAQSDAPNANECLVYSGGNVVWDSCSSGGGITGSGTLNYLPKFTPNGSTLGDSTIYDNGNVGIGTTNPAQKLDVVGNIRLTGDVLFTDFHQMQFDTNNFIGHTSTNNVLHVTSGGDLFLNIDSNNNQSTAAFILGKDRTSNTGGTELFRIQEDGNVGIGSTTPGALLDVAGTGRFSGTLTANGSFVANNTFTLGDGGDTGAVDTSTWDITSAGVASGFTGITSSGTVTFSGLTAARAVFTTTGGQLTTTGTSADLAASLSNETGTGVAVFGTSPSITTALNTGSTTFSLVNSTATTVNFAQAATNLTMGATTGTTTIRNATTALTGVLNVNGSGSSYFTGNLGIGTTTPGDKLHVVAGTVTGAHYEVDPVATFEHPEASLQIISTDQGSDAAAVILTSVPEAGTGDNSHWIFQHRGSASAGRLDIGNVTSAAGGAIASGNYADLTILQDGNIGVGSIAPAYKFDVQGGTGIMARFSGRVIGADAVNSNEFVTLSQLTSGTGQYWTDAGTYIYPTGGEVLGNSASAGSNKIAGIYLADSAPVTFGTDNDVTFSFSGSELAISQGNNDINFDSNTLFIDGSANFVGIGTSSPQSRLDISLPGAGNPRVMFDGSVANTANPEMRMYRWLGTATDYYATSLQTDSQGNLSFSTSNGGAIIGSETFTERFKILRTGNVGIGSTTPAYKLDVQGTGQFTGALTLGTQATATTQAVRADRNLVAGNGLTGGGNLTADRTFNVGAGSCVTVAADTVGVTANCVDATTLDSIDSGSFLRSDTSDQYTSGTLTFNSGTTLDINGDLSIADTNIVFDGASTNFATTGNFSINTSQFFINQSNGYIGLGTTSPTSKLSLVSDGTVANLFDITDNGSTIFQVTQANMISNVPAQFNAAGDVSIAYDLLFTNPTTSNIQSLSPLTISAGETFNSSNLTLQTYNAGNIVVDSQALTLTGSATIAAELTLSSKTTNGGVLYTNGSGTIAQSDAPATNECLTFNGTSPVWDSCASGGGITGSGTTNYISKFTGPGSIGNSSIYDNGNVGIGTTNPLAKLQLHGMFAQGGTPYGTADFTLRAADATTGMAIKGSSTYLLRLLDASDNPLFNVGGTGNVGIGTTTTPEKLTISAGNIQLDNNYSVKSKTNVGGIVNLLTYTSGNLTRVGANTEIELGGYVAFRPAGVEVARIISSGNFGIGTTAPAAKLNVSTSGTAGIVEALRLGYNNAINSGSSIGFWAGNTTTETARIEHNLDSSTTSSLRFYTYNSGLGERLRISANGNIGIGTTAPSSLLSVGSTSQFQVNSSGAIAAATGITSSGNITFSGLTAARAVFTTTGGLLTTTGTSADLAASLSNETGTGVAVFGTSPSITTALNTGSTTFSLVNTTATTLNFAGAATNITMGATTGTTTIRNATTSITGSLGIGTTTPGTRLHVAGNAYIEGTTKEYFSAQETRTYRNVAHYNNDAATQTGTVKIAIPTAKNNSNSMQVIKITGYNYIDNGGAWEAIVSGYNYSSGWINTSAEIRGSAPFTSVRLGTDGTTDVILLGDVATVWQYPQIFIDTVHVGYSNEDGYDGTWTLSMITDETGITVEKTPTIKTFIATNGNFGIGTTSPSYKLDVQGGTGIVGQFSGRVIGGNAVNSNEFVTLSQLNSGTGQYWTRTGSNLYPSTITDNVGIGTSSPGSLLHVDGTGELVTIGDNLHTDKYMLFRNDVSNGMAIGYSDATIADTNGTGLIRTGSKAFAISTGDGTAFDSVTTADFVVTSTGNVGIGTTAPVNTLQVTGTGAFSGNVGIGTTAPASLLQVRGAAPSLVLNNSTTNTANSGTIDFLEDDNALGSAAGYGFRLNYEGVGNRFAISSGNTTTVDERLTILRSNGNVGIGSTAPGFKLDVAGTGRFTGLLTLGAQATGTTHAVRADRNLVAGSGLTGGGNLTADRTFNVGAGSCVTVAADTVGVTANCVDATTLDSIDSGSFLRSDTSDQYTSGTLTFNSGTTLDINGDLSIADTDIAFDGASTNFAFTGNFSVNTDDLFLNKTSGNLGIGTTAPTSRLSLASDGTVANLFDVTDNGSTIFQITQSNIVANVPAQFNAAGDVSIAYDLNFTNPTASYIKSNAPLYLTSGKTYNSSDLTLETYNKGNVIVNTEALSLTGSATISAELTLSSKTTNGGVLYTNGSGLVSQSDAPSTNECLTFNGTSPVWDTCSTGGGISGSGTTNYIPKFTGASSIGNSTIYDNGNVGIGSTSPRAALDLNTGSMIFADTDYSGIYFGEIYNDALGHSSDWGYIRQAAANGQIEIGSDASVSFYETDGRQLMVDLDLNTGTFKFDGALQALDTTGIGLRDDAGTVGLWVEDGANVGVRTTNPAYDLDVSGNANFTGNIGIAGGVPTTNRALNSSASYTTTGYGLYSAVTGTNASIYGNYNTVTATGTLSGNRSAYGTFNSVTSTADDASFTNSLFGNYSQVVNSSGTTYDSAYGSYNLIQNNDTTLSATTSAGILGYVLNNSTGTLTNAYGSQGQIINGTTGTIGNAKGLYGYVRNDEGTMTSAYGVHGYVQQLVAGGTLSTAYGGYFQITQSAGTITNGYGVYIADVGATNQWGIYQTGATDNNYFAGNVGIGTTTTPQKLTVAGSIDASVQFLGQASDTVSAPSFSWTGDTNVGMFRPTTDTIGFTTAGSEKLRIASNGNVGIGTTTTGNKLVVNGTAEVLQNIYVRGVLGSATEQLRIHNNNVDTYIDYTGGNVNWRDDGSAISLFIQDTSGNVGIGSTSPTDKLDVVGNITASGDIKANGTYYYGDGKAMMQYSDAWLRINPANDFTSGIYAGTGTFRTDGTLQVGLSGSTLNVTSGGDLNFGSGIFFADDAGNVGIGTTVPATKLALSGGIASENGYNLQTGGTDNMLVNGDFEQGGTYGWTGLDTVVTGGYSGNYAGQKTGSSSVESDDYIPVDPTRDVIQLEGYFKKTVAGTTPGTIYFGYKAYDANKTVITTAPCGSYCYFAASGYTLPVDGVWHKFSATTTGEGTSYPNFPVGTKFVRVLVLINYGASADAVTQMDHVSVRKINNGPLFVGNNFASTNLLDQFQSTKLYTNASNNLIIDPPSGGHILPATDSTTDLGTSAVRFRNGYFDTLYGDGSNLTGITANAVAFSNITSGTNTGAAMVVGTGGSLTYSGSGTINASSLAGQTLTSASTASTVVGRDGSGDINARLFRSEYDTTNSSIGFIMTQIDTASNNYIRPSTPAQVVSGLGLTSGGSNDIWVNVAGDTMTGRLGQSTAGFNAATKDDITTRTDSGFFQTGTATLAEGWPEDSNSWYNLIGATHTNDTNHYATQFAGDIYNSNDIFYRATNNSGTTAWNRLWHEGNDGTTSGLDADLLDGSQRDSAYNSFGNGTIPVRHPSGYLYTNYLNTTANVTAGAASHFAIQTGTDGFIRWQTPADARTSLGLVAGGAGDIWVEKAGDTITGQINIVDASTGSAYNTAPLEINEAWSSGAGEAPTISFHYSGAVASQIGFLKGDSSGDISILDNPGTGYETLRVRDLKIGTTAVIDGSRNLVNVGTITSGLINGQTISSAANFTGTVTIAGNLDTNLTQGSVAFAGASGVLSQDTTNFYWDDGVNRLGIGTNAPAYGVTVAGAGATGGVAANSFYDYDNTAYYMDLAATGNSIIAAGNVGIGTTTTTQKLDVNGYVRGGTGLCIVNDCRTSWPTGGMAGSGTTNYIPKFTPNGTTLGNSSLFDNGSIGLGTNNPEASLHIESPQATPSATQEGNLHIRGTDSSGNLNYGASISLGGYRAPGETRIYGAIEGLKEVTGFDSSTGFLSFKTNLGNVVSERMRITGNGNVGIGTISPIQKLDVNGRINVANGVIQKGAVAVTGTSDLGLYTQASTEWMRFVTNNGHFKWFADGGAGGIGTTDIMNLQSNGNLGIGSTAPAQKLDVAGNIALSGTILMNNAQTMQAKNSAGTYETFMWPRWSDNVMYTNFGANGWNIRNNSSTSVMFINSSGSVGIGTTNPDRLLTAYFNNGNLSTGIFNFRQDGAGDAWGNFSLGSAGPSYAMGIDNSDADKFKIGYNAGGPSAVSTGTLLTIATNGNVGIGSTAPGSKLTVTGGFYASGSMHANQSMYIGGASGTSFWEMKTKADRPTPNECDTASTGGASLDVWCLDYGANNVSEFQIDQNGSGAMIGSLFQSSNPDVAEFIPVDDQSINSGDILVAVNSDMRNDGEEYDNVLATKATSPYQPTLIGAVSSGNPFLVGLNNPTEIWHKEDVTTFEDKRAMILTGRNYVKVSTINGEIKAGDLITTSTIPGIGMKATQAGFSVGRALQSFNGTSSPHAQIIVCPAGTPAGVTCAKIMVQLNVAWTDPEVQLADSGNLTITGTDAGSFKVWAGQYNFTRKGGFAEVVVAKLVAGITTTQQLVVNGQTQLLGTVKIGTQTLQEYILSVVQNAGLTNNNSESDQIATNIISPLANGKVTIDGDTEVNGTLKAKKIIADEIEGLDAKIATLSAGTITASQAAITNITNITNVYNTASNSGQIATDSASVASDSAEVATDEADLATDSASASASANMTEDFTDGEIQTEYMDLASSSAALAYTPTLSSEFATFTKGLMSFGPSTFADVSVTGQFSVNGSLIMAENSINTLGGTLEIQPLAQGDVSFMAGLMTLDTEGNLNVAGNAYFAKDVTVKGTLAAHIISPVPSEDLIIRLPSMLADGPNRDSKLVIQNASGSGVLEITNTGDLTASGSGQFANVAAEGFSIIRGAQADISATQTVASSSAGVATIKANYTERTIVSDFVTEDSLIYLTPVGATGGLQPYVARQIAADPEEGVKGSFTIQIPSRALSEMKINWFIVN